MGDLLLGVYRVISPWRDCLLPAPRFCVRTEFAASTVAGRSQKLGWRLTMVLMSSHLPFLPASPELLT